MKLLTFLCLFVSALALHVQAAQLTISWDASTGSPVGYKVERAPGLNATTGFVEVQTVLAPAVSWVDTSLALSTAYSYRIRAYNADALSGYSNVASGTTRGAGPSIPGAPKVTPPPAIVALGVGQKLMLANSATAKPHPNDPVRRMKTGEEFLVIATN